ncbi:MAG: winged helix-turn-helix domain-containing protein [Alphaproteobacteria bacterium]
MSTPFDHKQIDDVIHGRVRLAIMAFLASVDEADFAALKAAVSVTDGNLSVHLRKLEEAGYITLTKSFVGRRPNTTCTLTDEGRSALVNYVDHIEALLQSTRTLKP